MINERLVLFAVMSLGALVFHSVWLHTFRSSIQPRVRPFLNTRLRLQERRYHDYESPLLRRIDPIDRIHDLKKMFVAVIELGVYFVASVSPWLIIGLGFAMVYGAVS